MASRGDAAQRRLDEMVVVITGGSTGMGRACSVAYAEQGAKVIVGDIDAEQAEVTLAEILGFPSNGGGFLIAD